MKTLFGTEVDLRAGHIALDGFPALREKGHSTPPHFRPMSIVATVAHLSYCCALVVLLAASARPRDVQSTSWRIRELPSYHCYGRPM